MIRVSVCMATYNGGLTIREQLDSILTQLGENDEIVVCDDRSCDDTFAIIEAYADPRIRLFPNPHNLGHVKNFERAMSLARGHYIALSDQDDIWVEGRLGDMMVQLQPLPPHSLVVCDFAEFGSAAKPAGAAGAMGPSPRIMLAQLLWIFLGRAGYFGCCFLFRRELMDKVLPIPGPVEAHDVWIAMHACLRGRIVHTQKVGLKRRVHGRNLTPARRRGLAKVLWSRLIYLYYCSAFILRK